MAGLADIVKVNLVTQGAAVKQPSFGVPLIAAAHTRFVERSRRYTSLDGMLADGFLATDGAYLAAAKLLSQNPQVEAFRVGRRALAPTQKYKLTPVAQNAATYRVSVDGADAIFVSDATATAAEIATGLKTAIDALAKAVTTATADAGTTLEVTANAAGQHVSVGVYDVALLGLEQTNVDPGVATDLAAIQLENGDWYGLTLVSNSKAEIVAAAAWAEANGKLACFSSCDSAIVTTVVAGATDVAAALKTANYARSAVFYSLNSGDFPGAAALGKFLPMPVGSATLKFKTLAGVPTAPLTASQLDNARAKNANVHVEFGGVTIVVEGVVAVGEFLDVIRDRDSFQADMQRDTFTLLSTLPKVPYTDGGATQLEGVLRGVGRRYERNGFLAPDSFKVSMPRVATVASADKTARHLSGVTFEGTIAGAIHKLTISGRLAV